MTAAVATPPVARGLRTPVLAPVPESEPPFDDALPGRAFARAAAPVIPGPTGLDDRAEPTAPANRAAGPPVGLRRSAAAARPQRTAPQVLGPTTILSAGVPPWSSESDIGVRKTATEHLPPAGRAASVFARALVEVLSGQRPVAQLRVHCAPEIYAGLVDRPRIGPLALPHLLTVRLCEPADGVAEVSAAFRRAERVRALAFRLQGVDGRWRITALQVG